MPIPRTRTLGYRVVEDLTQGHTVIRIHKVSNPSHLPIVIIHSTSQSCLLPHHQCSKGREGERKGKGEEGSPPSPQRAPFWSGERPLMKAPADAAELAVSAWEPRGDAGRASLLPISTQVLHQSARLLPGAEARGTALLTVGGGHSSLAGSGPCPLPFGGRMQTPRSPHSLTPSPISQLRADAVTPGDALMKMADINLFPLPTGQFIVPWGALALSQRA